MNRLHKVVNSALTLEINNVRIDGAEVMIDPPAVTLFDQLIAWSEVQ